MPLPGWIRGLVYLLDKGDPAEDRRLPLHPIRPVTGFAIWNPVNKAVKFTPDGGKDIICRTERDAAD